MPRTSTTVVGALAAALLAALTAPALAQDAAPDTGSHSPIPSATELAAAATRKNRERLKQLSPAQRQALLAKYERYKQLGPEQRQQLETNLRTMRELAPDQVEQLRANQQRYATLRPDRRAQMEQRVGKFRELAPDTQRSMLEQAEAWTRLSADEQQRIHALPREQQKTAFKAALAQHRRRALLRKLTPGERQAIAEVPDAELRRAIHGVMQTRREAQVQRLPETTQAQLAALPPGTERDMAFRRAIDGVNRFEREAYGLLTPDERRAVKQLAPLERSARMRELVPQLRERAMQRLPETMRAQLAGLPVEQQVAQMRAYRQQKMLERVQSMLKPEQRWLVSRLPKNDRMDWARELAEANRDRMVQSFPDAQRTAYEQLTPGERERWLRQWVAGAEPGSKRDPRNGKRTGDSPRDRARDNARDKTPKRQ